jgi:hypothetical protein
MRSDASLVVMPGSLLACALYTLEMATLTAGDDGASDTAGTTQGHLGGHVDVGHVFILAKKREVEENGKGRGVGGQYDELANASVQSLGRLQRCRYEVSVCLTCISYIDHLPRWPLS